MVLDGIPRLFGARRKVRVGKHQSYQVTMLGKQKAEEFALTGPRWQVLAYIAESGPASVRELTRETSMDEEKVRMILKGLIGDEYVQSVSRDD